VEVAGTGADVEVAEGEGADAWPLGCVDEVEEEPQPVATAQDASTTATAERLWIEFMELRLAI
jgi:hypothetical protein